MARKKLNSGWRSGYKSISAPDVTSTYYKRRGKKKKTPMTELLVGAIVW